MRQMILFYILLCLLALAVFVFLETRGEKEK